MSREIPIINVSSWERLMQGDVLDQISKAMPGYITSQRWYRAKAKTIRELTIEDVVPIKHPGSCVLIVRVDYTDRECDTYFLPLCATAEGHGSDVLACLHGSDGVERLLEGALSEAGFRESLLDAIACESQMQGSKGSLLASRTKALTYECDKGEKLESSVSRAEQSNSSLIFGDRFILKVFRKLESGINPDLEIGRFLTARGFEHTPAVLGELEYRPAEGEPMHAGILQSFVRNEGDAWKYTLESLKPFFARAAQKGAAPDLQHRHPMDLYLQQPPESSQETIGEYLRSARLLGSRTAQMHAALTDPNGGPDFAPENFDPTYAQSLYQEMLNQADSTFELLDDKQNMLSGGAAESARRILAAQSKVRERFSSLRDSKIEAVRIRHHGDYHLGQVLYTGDDFVIIDFEGEPARPLAQRRIKTLAMRDVAGMARSFSYAAYAALEGSASDDAREWASIWAAWVTAEYLKGYFETASNAPFVGATEEERRLLFDAFVLQKALYEVSYELNNRPDWVEIPLQGILSLIE